jgi:2-oxoglutarate ferredoxin oxidoreductase subunit alpha
MIKAFDVADKYRNPVMILGDGMIGQMMEPVVFRDQPGEAAPDKKPWATTGNEGRKSNLITSIYLDPEVLDAHNWKLYQKYKRIEENEVMYESYRADDAEWLLVAYGTVARICISVMEKMREEGFRVGLIRPITLWPFPKTAFDEVADRAKGFLCVEMSTGQMVEDVRLAVEGRAPVYFYGRTGGAVPLPRNIEKRMHQVIAGRTPVVTECLDKNQGGGGR